MHRELIPANSTYIETIRFVFFTVGFICGKHGGILESGTNIASINIF